MACETTYVFLTFLTFFFKIQKTWLFTFFEWLTTFSRALQGNTEQSELKCSEIATFQNGEINMQQKYNILQYIYRGLCSKIRLITLCAGSVAYHCEQDWVVGYSANVLILLFSYTLKIQLSTVYFSWDNKSPSWNNNYCANDKFSLIDPWHHMVIVTILLLHPGSPLDYNVGDSFSLPMNSLVRLK